jgi:hypothetical protein
MPATSAVLALEEFHCGLFMGLTSKKVTTEMSLICSAYIPFQLPLLQGLLCK